MKTILMVDDSRLAMRGYQTRLSRECDVIRCYSAMEALAKSVGGAVKVDLLLLDVMMPPDPYGIEETQGGLATGIFLAKDLRAQYEKVPLIFLTNVVPADIERMARTFASAIVIAKVECTPMCLMERVRDILCIDAPSDRR